MAGYVRYIDRIREYYLSKYNDPNRGAHFENVPIAPLKEPLAESRVVLITTSQIAASDVERKESDGMQNAGGMYSVPADTPLDLLYSPADNYDAAATTLDDVDAYNPTTRLHETVKSGRIGSLTERFHGVFTQGSPNKATKNIS